jgi:hypothetical protein
MELTKLAEKPCFVMDGVEMREMKLVAHTVNAACNAEQMVIYRGPWRRVEDDFGTTYARGERVAIDGKMAAMLKSSEPAANVVFLDGDTGCGCSS